MSLDKNPSLDQDRVDVGELSPSAETAALEHPTTVPNHVMDGGSVNMKYGVVIPASSLSAGEDGIVMAQMLEDPARNRILGICHIRQTGGVNRQLYLYSAPWGHPEGPWTRLNASAAPLVGLGAPGAFDATNVFVAQAFIAGNNLYLAYAGTSGPSPEYTGKVGLATADLTQAAPVATKLGQLNVGKSPYYGYPAGLANINGEIILWVAQASSAGGWMTVPVPRPYYATKFSTTASDWTPDKKFYQGGDYDIASDGLHHPCLWPMVYLGENRWVRVIPDGPNAANMSLYTVGISADSVVHSYLGNVYHNHPDSAASAIDSARMFYHLGKWYFSSHDFKLSGAPYEVALGVYDLSQPMQSYSGDAPAPAQTRGEYPYTWYGALPSPATVTYVANGPLYDLSVAGQATITGTGGSETQAVAANADGLSSPAYMQIDSVSPQTPTAAGLLRVWMAVAVTPFKLAQKIYYPTSATAGPHAGDEVAAATTFTGGGPLLIRGKTL